MKENPLTADQYSRLLDDEKMMVRLVSLGQIIGTSEVITEEMFSQTIEKTDVSPPPESTAKREPQLRRAINQDRDTLPFGLTEAEYRLARLLARGLTVSEIAIEIGVSDFSLRYLLTSIHAKTGTTEISSLKAVLLEAKLERWKDAL